MINEFEELDKSSEKTMLDNDQPIDETYIELHDLVKERLKHDDLQDRVIKKICEIER